MSVSAELSRPRAAVGLRALTAHWHRVALGAVLAMAAVLDFAHLGRNGYANTYYAAAVRSMSQSWHSFFYASLDPGGLVTVDKPPLALWLEVASVKLFGYSGVAILLPEALCGVLAVAVLYALVARYFGRIAGLVAALALAVSPVSVAVNRDNNPDALFALLLVLAAWFGARAVESGRLRHVLLAAAAIGLAFETKMLVALLVLPGIALAYAAFSPAPWRRRALHLAAGAAVLVVVSGAWVAAVQLTSPAGRPWVGSTSDNSALSLLLGYNGLGRLTGQEGGTSAAGGLGGAFSGAPGVFRLLNDALGGQIAWLLPLAIVGGVTALAFLIQGRRRRELGAFTILGGWFAAGAFVFSYASGIVHTYYVSALAPALAALVGIGAVALVGAARRGGAWLLLPAVAFAATAWVQLDLLRRTGYQPWLQLLVIATALAAAALIALDQRRVLAVAAVACAVGGSLAAPAAWAAATLASPVNGVFPVAGPSVSSGPGRFGGPPGGGFGRPGGGGGFGGSADTATALAYATAHGATSRYALVVSSETAAAPFIIDGEAVAAMGGFTGRETVLSPAYLARLVSSGDARYFLVDDGGSGSVNAGSQTVAAACTLVPAATWGGTSGTLYDCAGRAAELAR